MPEMPQKMNLRSREPEPTQKEKPEPADISPDNPQAQVETGKVEETTGPKQKGNLFEGHVADNS